MSLLLNIDTATETASVCISLKGVSVGLLKNIHQKEHASFVHLAVQKVFEQSPYSLKNIDAFAVTSGPGSYTGLRVAMSAAKGFCYALSKPLITENTLKVMAKAALDFLGESANEVLLCPMIDARRMEVFTALYNSSLQSILAPAAMILSEGIFNNYLAGKEIIFFGSGSKKFSEMEKNNNSRFIEVEFDASTLAKLADRSFAEQRFSDVSYAQPEYFKEFYSTQRLVI